jgi:hypothetical protein
VAARAASSATAANLVMATPWLCPAQHATECKPEQSESMANDAKLVIEVIKVVRGEVDRAP